MDNDSTLEARTWSYDELVAEGMSLIPAHAPGWTDYNPSDPGVTLIELLAYFSEILVYRARRVSPDAMLNFLRLLHPAGWPHWRGMLGGPVDDVQKAIRERVAELSCERCAVTAEDFQALALQAAGRPVRVTCLPGTSARHLRGGTAPPAELAGDMCVMLAPERELAPPRWDALCRRVQKALAGRCLLTSRVQVAPAAILHIGLGGRIVMRDGFDARMVLATVQAGLRRRFGPFRGDDASDEALRHGFGQPVHLSEAAAVIDRIQGVDHVEGLTVLLLSTDDRQGERVGVRVGVVARLNQDAWLGGAASRPLARLVRDADGGLTSVLLQPWELAEVSWVGDAMPQAGAMELDHGA